MESYEYRGYTIEINEDEDCESPREWDNLGTMLCWHRCYSLGDKHDYADPQSAELALIAEYLPDFEEKLDREYEGLYIPGTGITEESLRQYSTWCNAQIQEKLEKYYIVLPLYLLDHSGITMRTSSFNDPWDSGQVGFIYVSKAQALKEYSRKRWSDALRKRVEAVLQSEVEVYDQYLRGDCYSFSIFDADGNQEDGCSGFFGEAAAKEEAENMVDYLIKEGAKGGGLDRSEN